MILILFFILFNFLNTEETEAMKAMDKKLFKMQLEKDLRNLENSAVQTKSLEVQKEEAKNTKEPIKNEASSLKEKPKIIPKVVFKYNQKEYIKLLDDVTKTYKLKVSNKENIIIGSKIEKLDLMDKLYGNANFFYYPIKKTKYNFSKKFNFYFIKKTGTSIRAIDLSNLPAKEEKGEIFDIFVEEFQEEIY